MTPPIRFALGTGAAWIALRTASLLIPLPWGALTPGLLPPSPRSSLVTSAAASIEPPGVATGAGIAPGVLQAAGLAPAALASLATLAHAEAPWGGFEFVHDGAGATGATPADQAVTSASAAGALPTAGAAAAPPVLPPPARGHGSSVTGSAWLFLRGGEGGPTAAPGGELAGSQAGARVAWRPRADVPVALAVRVSGPTGGEPGAEAALGLAWQPEESVPATLTVERRAGLDRGGRDAWAAYAAGGAYDKHLPGGLRLDAYGEAGVVGARRRDLFADGGVRVGEPVAVGARATLTLGAGVWGAAQPHLARVDAGPQAALRIPVGRTGITAAADWRFRIAGDARPRSGPALTIGVDF